VIGRGDGVEMRSGGLSGGGRDLLQTRSGKPMVMTETTRTATATAKQPR
jgi:hypothetical protein